MGADDLIAALSLLRSFVPSADIDLGYYAALTGILIILSLTVIGLGFIVYRLVYVITHKEIEFFIKFVFMIGVSLVILSLLLP